MEETQSNIEETVERDQDSPENRIIVCIAGREEKFKYEDHDLTFNSSPEEILTKMRLVIQEEFKVDIKDESSGWLYKINQSTNKQNTYIIPNSTAG